MHPLSFLENCINVFVLIFHINMKYSEWKCIIDYSYDFFFLIYTLYTLSPVFYFKDGNGKWTNYYAFSNINQIIKIEKWKRKQ